MNSSPKKIALFLAVGFLSCLRADAQNATVASWQGTITISAAGTAKDNEKGYTWTINHTGSGSFSLTPYTQFLSYTCPAQMLCWWGAAVSGTGSVNDQGTPIQSGGPASLTGSGPVTAGASAIFLTIDPANNTYTFYPGLAVDATFVAPGVDQSLLAYIGSWATNKQPVPTGYPGLTFSLPASIGDITQSNVTAAGLANLLLITG